MKLPGLVWLIDVKCHCTVNLFIFTLNVAECMVTVQLVFYSTAQYTVLFLLRWHDGVVNMALRHDSHYTDINNAVQGLVCVFWVIEMPLRYWRRESYAASPCWRFSVYVFLLFVLAMVGTSVDSYLFCLLGLFIVPASFLFGHNSFLLINRSVSVGLDF